MSIVDKFFNYMGFEVNDDEIDEKDNQPKDENIREFKAEKKQRHTQYSGNQRKTKIFDIAPQSQSAGMQVAIYKPKHFDDIKLVADELKNGKPVIVNFSEISDNSYSRMLDCLSGVLYAIEGDLIKIANYIYLASPKGVHAVGNVTAESLFGSSFENIFK